MNSGFRVAACALGLAAVSAAPMALAQAYPVKPIRLIVSSPPGGVNDTASRALSSVIGPVFGQAVVVENRGGANGNIGGEACARAVPDGYSVCFINGVAITFNPFAYRKMPYDPQKDLRPVIHVGYLDIAIAVNAAVPVNNMKELVVLARSKPGALNWGSLGIGSNSHMYEVWLEQKEGVKFTHIPYKGSPQLTQALLSGEVQAATYTPGTALPHVKAGKWRVIAVVTGKKRSPLMPEVPSLDEQGYDLDFRNWNGIFVPAGTPDEVVRRWNTEVNRILVDRAFVEKYLGPLAVTPSGGTPDEFAEFMKKDRDTAALLVKLSNMNLLE